MDVWKLKMLYFDRIEVSEKINSNKASESKEHEFCQYWYFLNKSFKFQPNIFCRWHDLLMMSMNLKNIAILNIKVVDYHCIITEIRRNEAISVIQNTDLKEKRGTLQNTKKFIFIYKNE